jgi:hypothetical protein
MKPVNPLRVASLAGLFFLIASCGYDNVSSTVINGPATLTTAAPRVDFAAYTTFSMPSAVTQVTQSGNSSPTFTCDSSATAQQILQTVATNMTKRGYTQGPTVQCQGTNTPPTSDLAINVSSMNITNTSVSYYPCYWWGYYGYPSYGCYYPYAWVSTYTTGTIITQMSDVKNRPPDGGAIEDLWAAVGYSVLTGGANSSSTNAVFSINQAFTQSPYIHTP